jgi:hypothetical protein
MLPVYKIERAQRERITLHNIKICAGKPGILLYLEFLNTVMTYVLEILRKIPREI